MGEINYYASTNIFHILNNPSARELLFNSKNDLNEFVYNSNVMENVLSSNPYIHSIYIYNARENVYNIISDRILVRKGDMYDKEVSDLIKNYNGTNPVPRIIPYSENEAEREIVVYTYIIKEFEAIETGLPYTIIINVYADALFNLSVSSQAEADSLSEIYCITSKGQVVASKDKSIFLKDVSGLPYISELLNKNMKEGYFLHNEGEQKKVLIYTKTPILDWYLVYVIPYQYISQMLNNARVITIILIIVNLIIGSLIAYFLSKSLYRPINKLKNAVKRKEPGSKELTNKGNEKQLNEIELLISHFEGMQSELDEIDSKNRKSAHYTKRSLLLNLLNGRMSEAHEFESVFKQYNIPLTMEDLAYVVILKIDNYASYFSKKFSASHQILYKFALNNLASELIGEKFPVCDSVDPGEDFTVTVISLNQINNEDEIIDTLKQCIKKIQEAYQNFIQVSVSGFISRKCYNLYEVRGIYRETIELSKQRFVYGHECILSTEEQVQSENGKDILKEEQVEELINALKNGNAEKANEIFKAIKTDWDKAGYENILYGINYIYYSIVNSIMSIEVMSKVNFNIDCMEYYDQIKESETFDLAMDVFRRLFQDVAFAIDNIKGNKTDVIVQKVNRFIEENYMLESLNGNNVADHVFLSQRYINRVYKQNTGYSIADYIKKCRLTKAALLLEQTSLTVDEILQEVGWTTKEYFYIIFKKQFGLTPGDYRINLQSKAQGHRAP